ncbi:MAG: hypothetical protein ACREAM_26625 [Blastocatellia bacterium]
MDRSIFKLLALALCVIAGLTCAPVIFAQFNDWKGQKIETTLKRKRPPEYFVIGTKVKLEIKSQGHSYADYANLLRARLESGLFAQDSRLQSEEMAPATVIACEITRLDADDNRWDQRTEKEYKKVGQYQEWNREKGRYETKDRWDHVQVTKRYRVVRGGVNISYHTRDAKTRATLDAQNIQASFNREYLDGAGSPSAHEVRETLVNSAVGQLATRLTPTVEPLTVYLPRGKVEDFSKLGRAGLWEKMREGVEKMGTLPKPSDEAYRQYGIGIANEALAYQEPKVEEATKLLEEAGVNYNKALELKPDEKYFREPLARIEQSLAQYKKLSGQLAAYAQSKAVSIPPPPQPDTGSKGFKPPVTPQPPQPAPPAAPNNSQALTNQKVIEMVKAGLDDANIIATINSAPAALFDLSADGLINLSGNKVSINVINAMRQRLNKPLPRRATAPARRKN